ncbi:MAG TPA: BolA family protein [Alphaproteobacteria bacterium]|nr:BolA family protein [Alphaproteobacteria bacterium]
MDMAARIRAKLGAALAPSHLEIVDESARHAGHAGARPGGETHFRVEIVAAAFEGCSRVARQRRVYEILKDELAGGVHALSLSTLTPAEAEKPHTPV